MASAAAYCPSSCNLHHANRVVKREAMEGRPIDAILAYTRMQESGLLGDNFTFPVLLKAASDLPCRRLGASIHAQATKAGYSDHTFVQTALLGMYSALGEADDACRLFKAMPKKDLVAWNSMLKVYARHGRMGDALELFVEMPLKDQVSFNTLMSGFAKAGDVERAAQVFGECPARDTVTWNTMISACAKAGLAESARHLFEQMPEKSVVSWNILMAGYMQSQLYDEAVELFHRMVLGGFEPNYLTFASVLSACAKIGSLSAGKEIHTLAGQLGLAWNPHVAASLIDMYAKCGSIEGALSVFYKAPHRDIFCWNAMVSGLALHGHAAKCLDLFDEMLNRGIEPDSVTFVALLTACSHVGLVEDGRRLFAAMEKRHGVVPRLEHYGCLVDLLARAGRLACAYEVVGKMPFEPDPAVLGALLGACIVQRDLHVGEAVAARLAAAAGCLTDGEYMMLSNLYAACGKWEDASRWRGMMNRDDGVKKTAGWSSVEVVGRVHRFLSGEN